MRILYRLRYRIGVFLAVLGPGFITAVVDNDSGGIFTYSAAGARWGYLPLWTLVPITLVLIITQEMCSRMGAVTGKGLSDLLREEFGLRITFFVMAPLVLVNLTNVMSGPGLWFGDVDWGDTFSTACVPVTYTRLAVFTAAPAMSLSLSACHVMPSLLVSTLKSG